MTEEIGQEAIENSNPENEEIKIEELDDAELDDASGGLVADNSGCDCNCS